ncbi:type II toxin-antitoxin system Phd/YefM family antitoxin [Desulfatirhabdium butyrativorans]|uniref:type II toxin-antitoxin system Phd/YefM family antitoxin n=1 Tax=Desulfatirhabdium butyrativorans TaxID=340467 RepID=UPI000423B40F|nr:type II toxin-antitoxin system prevent-host-death family antitoxin [Desulfatirhabdium butyrativorans]
MESVGEYEAKTHFPKLLERVSKGERITITRHGVPVAVLLPPECPPKTSPAKIIDELRNFRKQFRLDGLRVQEMIEEGRR